MIEEKLSFRKKLFIIIFESDTKLGKLFDVVLIISILLSVFAVMLDSMKPIRKEYGDILYIIEWFFTILFTIEYIARLYCLEKSNRYARSFYGIIDLLAIVPTYLSIILPGSQYFLVIRILRVLRIFRVLKFVQYIGEASLLKEAMIASRRIITVFLFTVLTLVVILGSLMYLIEGEKHGFTSIPRSIYWSIVTLTTVGYGDISPQTPLGQTLASFIMIVGYGIIAVPTGIVTVEMSNISQRQNAKRSKKICVDCGLTAHEDDAKFCKRCGSKLELVYKG